MSNCIVAKNNIVICNCSNGTIVSKDYESSLIFQCINRKEHKIYATNNKSVIIYVNMKMNKLIQI